MNKRRSPFVFVSLFALSSTLATADPMTFDTDLEGFAIGANATAFEWSSEFGGSMKLTAAGGWAGSGLGLVLANSPLWSDLLMALQNGGTLTFDLTVNAAEQTLIGDMQPNWFEAVVIGNSTNADSGGIGGWDSNTLPIGLEEAQWPLSPETQTINVEIPISKVEVLGNDGVLWLDAVTANGWTQLVIGVNNDATAVSEVVVYIDNIEVTAFSPEPAAWPGGASYTTDFSESLVPYWSLIGWTAVPLPVPVSELTGNQSDQAQWGYRQLIGDSDGAGAAGYYFNPETEQAAQVDDGTPFTVPIPVIKTPTDLSALDPGFGGRWLQNLPMATRDGKATLHFVDLPAHTGIDLDFVLAAFDTIDTGDWIGNALAENLADPAGDGANFRITVDGVVVHENRFNNSGTYANGEPAGVTNLGNQLNFSSQYREGWGLDDAGGMPLGIGDRHAVAWAEDSAYNFSGLFGDSGNVIPHTADTITVVIEHGFNGGWGQSYQDEGVAIDALTLTLVGTEVPPKKITEIGYDDGAIRLTWESDPGKTYSIFASKDMTSWGFEVSDNVLSDGESTTFPPLAEPGEPNPFPGSDRVFFRVSENPE